MGFFSKLFGNKQVHTSTNTQKWDEAYFDFEDRYEKDCNKKVDQIESIETNGLDPDKNIAGFKKQLELCHELEDFCASHGSGGAAYFKENYYFMYENIQKEMDNYIKYEYEEAKRDFEEEKADQKAVKSVSQKVLKEIRNAGGSILQTELKKLFSESELQYYNRVITRLADAGKIEKYKSGSRVAYKTK